MADAPDPVDPVMIRIDAETLTCDGTKLTIAELTAKLIEYRGLIESVGESPMVIVKATPMTGIERVRAVLNSLVEAGLDRVTIGG
jgi:biopolymer transport protein ExbD